MKIIIGFLAVLFGLYAFLYAYRGFKYKARIREHTRAPISEKDPDFKRDSELLKFATLSYKRRVREQILIKKYGPVTPEKLADDARVADIFYHPSKLRMAGLVVNRQLVRPASSGKEEMLEYAGRCVVGFRTSTSEPFELYDLGIIMTSDTAGPESAVVGVRFAFMQRLRRKSINVGLTRNLSTSGELGFGVHEPEFWESILWQKGIRHPDLFPFQVRQGFRRSEDIWIPVKPLVEEYPEWILEMYRQ
ncbi:MAG: hypothetical protein HKN43_05970 [Rhodothermales bacterium]|nr:hypothetical protein [Rhodothermales bacterium]